MIYLATEHSKLFRSELLISTEFKCRGINFFSNKYLLAVDLTFEMPHLKKPPPIDHRLDKITTRDSAEAVSKPARRATDAGGIRNDATEAFD